MKTAINPIKLEIEKITKKLLEIEPIVLKRTGIESVRSLNGLYGGKHAVYINMLDEIIESPDHFVALYMNGFKKKAEFLGSHHNNYRRLQKTPVLQEWLLLFLKRTYLRNYDALSKKRPPISEASMVLGQNKMCYGLFVTPRKNHKTGEWENDKSEIRHLPYRYWSIGHILNTGIVDFQSDRIVTFQNVPELLSYTKAALIIPQKSNYGNSLFNLYEQYVLASNDKESIPFLIPEYRYDGFERKHKYRLDFTIIFPNESNNSLNKIGIELSPWSSHGQMSGLKNLNQKEINNIAKSNWESEMQKRRDYCLKYNINLLTYTDSNLQDINEVWNEISKFLIPTMFNEQLNFYIINDRIDI